MSPVPLDDCLRFFEISVIVVVTGVVVVVLVNAEKVELLHSELLRLEGNQQQQSCYEHIRAEERFNKFY